MSPAPADQPVVDYDGDGYDYQHYWADRDYEQRGEDAALNRLAPLLDNSGWVADLGGGYGRNARYYRDRCRHCVLVDYSTTNVTNAARNHAGDVASGRMYIVRADLNALPFRAAAFDSAISIRVLHHLPDIDRALAEMLATVASRAILDVPIKHHVLARAQAAVHHNGADIKSDAPKTWGQTEFPFTQFRLDAVLAKLNRLGFENEVVASVNNFRRWDRRLPRSGVKALGPVMHGLELGMQRLGRGWWGPNQFVVATRRQPSEFVRADDFDAHDLPAPVAALAERTRCPACRTTLSWTTERAHCEPCARDYVHEHGYWDFTAAGSHPST